MDTLVNNFNFLVKLGHAVTASGQLSLRDQDDINSYWTIALGTNNPIKIEPGIKPEESVNFATKNLHSLIYLNRPDVNAIVHFHCDNTVAWSLLHKPFMFTTHESGVFYKDIVAAEIQGLLEQEQSQAIVESLGKSNSIIVFNHGSITVGKSLESAIWRTLLLEKICEINLKAMCAGTVHELNTETLEQCYRLFAKEKVMQYQFNNFKKQYDKRL